MGGGGETYKEVQSMLKGIFANLKLNVPPTGDEQSSLYRYEGGSQYNGGSKQSGFSPARPSEFDVMLAKREQSNSIERAR